VLTAALALMLPGAALAQRTPVTQIDPRFLPYSLIAFVGNQPIAPYSSQRDIFVIKPDGTGLQNLTNDALVDSKPVWSPDGSKIAFVTLEGGQGVLRVVNVDGTGLRKVINDQIEWTARVTWSPDSQALAYVATPSMHLWRVNVDGTQKTQLTTFKVGAADWGANNKLVFNLTEPSWADWMQLFSINPDGSGLTLLTRGGRKFDPFWSPDAQQLVFQHLGYGGVVLSKADGTEPDAVGDGWHQAWSRDSRKVTFISGYGNNVAVSEDGRLGTRYTVTGLSDSPSFSPDGQFIAYADRNAGIYNTQLMIIPAGGGTPRSILPPGMTLGRENSPAPGFISPRYVVWSPVVYYPTIRIILTPPPNIIRQ
jgi:Tol biopolymer transport system component